jgi:Sulfotransferase family
VIPPETGYFWFLDVAGFLNQEDLSAEQLPAVLDRYEQDTRFPYLGIGPEVKPALLQDANNVGDVFSNLMTHFLVEHKKQRWGEKTPGHLRYVDHIRRYFPDARFILVVRDGRAVIASQLKHPVWGWDLLTAARRWSRDARAMLGVMQQVDTEHLFILRFESLLKDPKRMVRDVCEFLGESFEPAMLSPSEQAASNAVTDAEYYDRPWMKKSTRAIDDSRANAWRSEYSAVRLKLVESVAGRELTRLGYDSLNPAAPSWPLLYLSLHLKSMPRRVRNLLNRAERRTDEHL